MTDTIRHSEYDAIIVGARCAGAATAMLLARRGLRVLAVDRSPYGSDTLSTHVLLRPALLQLARWGLLERLAATDTPAVTNTIFHYGKRAVELPMEGRDGVDALYSPRRTVLDPLLVDAAREAGAEVCHGQQLTGIVRDASARVSGVRLRAEDGTQLMVKSGVVIGADGRHSTTARLLGSVVERSGEHASASVYGYFEGLELDATPTNHWFYRPEISVGLTPTGAGLGLLFVSAPAHQLREALRVDVRGALHQGIAHGAPELLPALRRATQVGRLQGFGGQPGFLRRSHGTGWALVGDAGYFKDPLTAHGISDAFRDAELLAQAVAEGTDAALTEYQATRDRVSENFFAITDEIAACRWDLPRVSELHQQMSREIKRECDLLLELDPVPGPSDQPSSPALHAA
ncbi:MAG: NAD(P)/FAD-dependent oxidoreductase [Myxococcales bacterium]|nr:NAD(P)/FAD-dependent oxidoreductase [Myxococcales bacterium]